MSEEKIIIDGEDEYFDISPTEEFLDLYDKYDNLIDSLKTTSYFKREQNKEFYLGMVGGFRAALSVLYSLNNTEDMKYFINDACSMAVLIAKSKIK